MSGLTVSSTAVVTQGAGLWQLGMIDPGNILPIKVRVASIAIAAGGDMARRLERGVEQAVWFMALSALSWRTGKHSSFVTTFAGQIPVSSLKRKPRGKVIEPAVLCQCGPAERHQAEAGPTQIAV